MPPQSPLTSGSQGFVPDEYLFARWMSQAGDGTASKAWLLEDGICFGFGSIWCLSLGHYVQLPIWKCNWQSSSRMDILNIVKPNL